MGVDLALVGLGVVGLDVQIGDSLSGNTALDGVGLHVVRHPLSEGHHRAAEGGCQGGAGVLHG